MVFPTDLKKQQKKSESFHTDVSDLLRAISVDYSNVWDIAFIHFKVFFRQVERIPNWVVNKFAERHRILKIVRASSYCVEGTKCGRQHTRLSDHYQRTVCYVYFRSSFVVGTFLHFPIRQLLHGLTTGLPKITFLTVSLDLNTLVLAIWILNLYLLSVRLSVFASISICTPS